MCIKASRNDEVKKSKKISPLFFLAIFLFFFSLLQKKKHFCRRLQPIFFFFFFFLKFFSNRCICKHIQTQTNTYIGRNIYKTATTTTATAANHRATEMNRLGTSKNTHKDYSRNAFQITIVVVIIKLGEKTAPTELTHYPLKDILCIYLSNLHWKMRKLIFLMDIYKITDKKKKKEKKRQGKDSDEKLVENCSGDDVGEFGGKDLADGNKI